MFNLQIMEKFKKPRTLKGLQSLIRSWEDLTYVDISVLDTLEDAFNGIEEYKGSIANWDTSHIKNMRKTFFNCDAIENDDISKWNTSNVETMEEMFSLSEYFNGDISSWDTSKVKNMRKMFDGAKHFNQDISNWNTSQVEDMEQMFSFASVFNQPIGKWNTGKVKNMKAMFSKAEAFNQSLNDWNTSKVEDMSNMFSGAISFNQPIGNWNTKKVKRIYWMFAEAVLFNQNINNWTTSNMQDMSFVFHRAESFNQPLNNWDTSNVISMFWMFSWATSFNQDISSWYVRNVKEIKNIFEWASAFSQDLSKWEFLEYEPTTEGLKNLFKGSAMQFKMGYFPTCLDKTKWVNEELMKCQIIDDFEFIFTDQNFDATKIFNYGGIDGADAFGKHIEDALKKVKGFKYQWKEYHPKENEIKIGENVILLAAQTLIHNKLFWGVSYKGKSSNGWSITYQFLRKNKKRVILFLRVQTSSALIGVWDWERGS